MTVNGRKMTQDYFDFILARERVAGKSDAIDEIIRMIKGGMNIYNATQYQIDKVNKEIEHLLRKQVYYEGV